MDPESYLMLLLADSNLPTGSFVASSGLESYLKHGFTSVPSFIEDSLSTYARGSLAFVSDTHRVTTALLANHNELSILEDALHDFRQLDKLYESMTLSHVARRASTAQGVALLTLYARSFASPDLSPSQRTCLKLMEQYKTMVRRGDVPGHLPICFGALVGALGLSLERSQYLHLFLHARSLLSAAVRLNSIGPYHSQHLLLYSVQPFIDLEIRRCSHLKSHAELRLINISYLENAETVDSPASTWPLGDILSARHDLQHSRIFNS